MLQFSGIFKSLGKVKGLVGCNQYSLSQQTITRQITLVTQS